MHVDYRYDSPESCRTQRSCLVHHHRIRRDTSSSWTTEGAFNGGTELCILAPGHLYLDNTVLVAVGGGDSRLWMHRSCWLGTGMPGRYTWYIADLRFLGRTKLQSKWSDNIKILKPLPMRLRYGTGTRIRTTESYASGVLAVANVCVGYERKSSLRHESCESSHGHHSHCQHQHPPAQRITSCSMKGATIGSRLPARSSPSPLP
jgi:hypothetical protein